MEKIITVNLQSQADTSDSVDESMAELLRLVETAGGEVVESMIQKRDRPDPATLVGKGKVEELRLLAAKNGASAFIFDQPLKPAQQRNLEAALGRKVIDRTRLILDIFAQRARTREGQLQVELAQLDYRLPRLTGYGVAMDSQTGGIGTRGPGERKLEMDQRRIRDRITHLKGRIEKIRRERILQRQVRRSVPIPQVALVGYTNAGKSTLLNSLLERSTSLPAPNRVYADDKLFATLDPTTRRVRLPSGRAILFSDTVGFIRRLPAELIAAFRATLEEVANSDLLLVVVDSSDPAWEEQEKTVGELLTKLDAHQLPRLTAYNKMDLLSVKKRDRFQRLDSFQISAETGKGLKDLLAAIEKQLSHQWVEREILFSYAQGGRLAQLHEHMDVLSQQMTERGIRVRVRAHPTTLAQWLKHGNEP